MLLALIKFCLLVSDFMYDGQFNEKWEEILRKNMTRNIITVSSSSHVKQET